MLKQERPVPFVVIGAPLDTLKLLAAVFMVVDHINEEHINAILVPDVPPQRQRAIGDLVRHAFANKDTANHVEDQAIADIEDLIRT